MTRGDVVFLESPHRYESYADFWSLVDLSGFRRIPIASAKLSDGTTYVCPTLDVEFMKLAARFPRGSRGGRLVFWCLERPDAHVPTGMDPLDVFRRGNDQLLEMADEVWVSDRGLNGSDPRTRFAVMGGHAGLWPGADLPRRPNDVVHIGQATPRRREILDRLRGLKVSVAEGAWGLQRAFWMSSSKILISIDRMEELHVSAPIRWAVAAAHRIPIVSERIPDPYPLVEGRSVLMDEYDGLPDRVLHALADPETPKAADAAWETMCGEWTFERGVLEAADGR